MFCPECGAEVGNAKFCENCGSPVASNQAKADLNQDPTQVMPEPAEQATAAMQPADAPQPYAAAQQHPTAQMPPAAGQQAPSAYGAPAAPVGGGQQPQDAPPKNNKTPIIIGAIIAVVVIAAAVAIGFFIGSSGGSSEPSGSSAEESSSSAAEPVESSSASAPTLTEPSSSSSSSSASSSSSSSASSSSSSSSSSTSSAGMQTIGSSYVGTIQVPKSWTDQISMIDPNTADSYEMVFYADPKSEYNLAAFGSRQFSKAVIMSVYPTNATDVSGQLIQGYEASDKYDNVDYDTTTISGCDGYLITTEVPGDGVLIASFVLEVETNKTVVVTLNCGTSTSSAEEVLACIGTWKP